MNTALFVNATIGSSEKPFIVIIGNIIIDCLHMNLMCNCLVKRPRNQFVICLRPIDTEPD